MALESIAVRTSLILTPGPRLYKFVHTPDLEDEPLAWLGSALSDVRAFPAAELFRVTQPRVSDLVRGKIERFSVDSLLEMLGHAGADVSFVVTAGRRVA